MENRTYFQKLKRRTNRFILNKEGFNEWADGYDRSTARSDADGSYPFAGYNEILHEICRRVLSRGAGDVLDIGFGTGVLTAMLYDCGCRIYGQDFSDRMIALAQEKMPGARLYCGDFTQGLAGELMQRRYDAIVATYSLHHLTDARKVTFLRELLPLLREGGVIYIGDVAFETRAELEACRAQSGERWDNDEIYFVYDKLRTAFPAMTFDRLSPCAGILSLRN